MMVQELPLFDRVKEGEQRKRDAITQVKEHANPDWIDSFRAALARVAYSQYQFTSDAVWDEFERSVNKPSQHEPRAAGAVMVQGIKTGLIRPVKNLFWKSTRPACHRRPKQVYQSLVKK